jgi:hypothetical protein
MATILRAISLLALAARVSAFAPRPAPRAFMRGRSLVAEAGGGGGAGATPAKPVITARPKERTRPKVEEKRAEPKRPERQVAEPKERLKEKKGAPQWRVMLLGDEGYDKGRVVAGLKEVCKGLSSAAAEACFAQAQSHDKAEVTVAPQETAEAFVQALQRMDPIIYATAEDPEEKNAG